MKLNTPTLMWARQNHTGDVWHESAALTKPVVHHWPPAEEDEAEKTESERDHEWGQVKLFRVTVEPVTQEEQDAYLAEQEEFFRKRREARERK